MAVVSISGIRGIINQDLSLEELLAPVGRFGSGGSSAEFLLGRDTRATGPMISQAVMSTLLSRGRKVIDYGVVSTPALFRESRTRLAPAVMITASHNEPEWNGIKFIVEGRGISQPELDRITRKEDNDTAYRTDGSLRGGASTYTAELIERGGRGTCEGVRAVLDLNGGASIGHAPAILTGVGCDVSIIGGTKGVFSRTIDPTADDLTLLCRTVKTESAEVGYAFDCDGDRLVLVDQEGQKRTGDFMLTLAIKTILPSLENRDVVVSVDTTRAVDDVVGAMGGRVYRSKVGEANVVSKMVETGATLGGEGSSGGLIDGSYNYCRDSMLAAVSITKAIAKSGSAIFGQVPSYRQARLKFSMNRKKALAAVKKLQRENPEADLTDGLKLRDSKSSWVLIRVSGTEDAVRVSAESRSQAEAEDIANTYLKRVKSLG